MLAHFDGSVIYVPSLDDRVMERTVVLSAGRGRGTC